MYETIQNITIMALPVLMAITLHELAHGWVAGRLGDDTARLAGRLTLNPLKHLDPVGTLAFVVTQFIGWAKPIPVNINNLKDPKRGLVWVALAGPSCNLGIALICTLLYKTFQGAGPIYQLYTMPAFMHKYPSLEGLSFFYMVTVPLYWMIILSIQLNIALAVFNMIPIPPLDGGRILSGIHPHKQSVDFSKIEPYGFIILIMLIFTGMIDLLVFPVIGGLLHSSGDQQ